MHNFIGSETGAVTVDWVVLTAGLVGLGLATMAVVSTGVQDVSQDTNCQLHSNMIQSSFGISANDVTFAAGCLGSVYNSGPGEFAYSDAIGSDGQPGFLHYTDGPDEDYAVIPAVQSDMSSLYGGSVSWDVKMISNHDPYAAGNANFTARETLAIVGSDGTVMELYQDSQRAGTDWTNISIAVDESAGWEINGNPATEAQMRAVLSDVQETRVLVEQTSVAIEEVGFDGLSFNEAT